jgi:prepilin-type N-terminal cleavage/methylation domain-containing protein
MKLPFVIYDLRFAICKNSLPPVAAVRRDCDAKNHKSSIINHQSRRAFTMIEIAISLAIIGIALVGIIGVLPLGLNTQRDNRESTIINQDATVFIEAVRNGARGADDLTNYVYAIVITDAANQNVYINPSLAGAMDFSTANFPSAPPIQTYPILTNGANIVGLLSTPEFLNANGGIADSIYTASTSNHVVAYVRSISGPAVEKPPQDNQILQQDSFSYHIYCVNALAGNPTQPWQPANYNEGDVVAYVLNNQTTYWQAIIAGPPPQAGDVPNSSPRWVEINNYYQQIAGNLHELRLTFEWPQLPNGNLPPSPFRQTYRTTIGGQITSTNYLYFYQPQSFTSTP